MAVVIFALGIKATNGLVKSTINTANSLISKNIDVSIINIIGKLGGLDFLDPAFPLDNRVQRYSLDMAKLNLKNEIKLKNSLFFSEKQQYLKANYTEYHAEVLRIMDKRLNNNDLIIFTHPLAMVLYVKANPQSNVKKLIQVHGNYLEEHDNFDLLKEYFDKVDYIQTVSKYMRDDLVNILHAPKEKTIYIPNITVPIQIEKVSKKYLKRVSIIGSIQKRKNQYDAIRMIENIEDRNIILQIYGNPLDKEYTNFIKEYIVRKKLGSRVVFKGVASEHEIYANSDVVILPSEHEGFGYTFLESALYGIPTVAYDFKYGAKEFLIKVHNYCLVPIHDYIDMATKVLTLLENKNIYQEVIELNKNHFKESYSESRIINQYISLLGDKNKKVNFFDIFISKKIADLRFTYIEKKKKQTFLPAKIEKKLECFYYYTFHVVGDIQDMKLFYYYKNERNLIHYTSRQENGKVLIEFKIALRNKKSNFKRMKGFFIFAEDKNYQEYYMGYLSKKENYEILHTYKNFYPNSIGTYDIANVKHILNTKGLFIQYPKAEAISRITNEKGKILAYETKILKIDGEYLPSFKIKEGIYKIIIIEMNSREKAVIHFDKFRFGTFFDQLQDIETKYLLYNKKIANVNFWELIRASIFENILESTGVLNTSFSKVKSSEPYIYHGKKTIWGIPNCDKLIFEFPRKNAIDYRTKSFQQSNELEIIIEYPQSDGYTDRVYDLDSNIYPIERYLKHSKNYKPLFSYSNEDKALILDLETIFKNELGLNIDFLPFIDNRIKKFKKEFSFFDKFFKEKEIKEILIPSSYWSAGIISAATENGVLASDIQYALISSQHPSFSFPKNQRVYSAEKVYLWSKYWDIEETSFRESNVFSSNYFQEKCNDLGLTFGMKIKYDIAFVSQSRIGNELFQWAYTFSLENQDFQIVFCPHPDESLIHYENYFNFLALENTSISSQDTLLEVAVSKSIIGVYSTTLFESLALKKQVFVANINGYEVVQKEIDKAYFSFIEEESELREKLMEYEENKSIDFAKLFYNFSF